MRSEEHKLIDADPIGRITPSDDSEPITPEWLQSIGFKQSRPCHIWATPDTNWWSDKHKLEIWELNDTGTYLWIEYDSVEMKTRRDLRLLIEWAGLRSRT